ncbi:conserved hypothetical protein [Gloeothece citriformis PCC 7424]|uniref:DUF4435 domain-containing protein n=1 Tax=Gloeothece citriformis (strain PCC 7424) TaxID=65393 RepID=B7KHA5_GLOC7|nr:DUF4435 domain-containing protein [Gloeothece citriformis]ACK69314.1 conserved hypothetical protein [Gloeothece citriformis PCC 7424]
MINRDANRRANQIRLRRDKFLGTFLIVEGTSDKLIYERLVNSKKCEVVVANSKFNAIEILKILEQDNFKGILAIVDADFSRLEENQEFTSDNLLLTDDHDLEMMLIKSPAFEKFLRERGSEEKINKFPKDIRETLLEVGQEIGYLRWHSLLENLSLKFEELNFNKFINKKNLSLDVLILITTVKNHSQKLSLQEQEIQEKINQLKKNNHDLWQVCCGHDLICLLSIALCKAIGSCKHTEVETEILERELRLAYEGSFFLSTHLYSLIKVWENKNLPYLVLLETV